MQLVRKTVKGYSYWYLVQKGRKDGVVTNVKTIYLGTADRLAAMLAESGETQFPASFDSWEVGASAALCSELRELDVLRIIDEACPARRADATLSYGQLLAVIALQRAIAPRPLRSLEHLRQWYEGCGARELLPMDPAGLDARRVHEALELLRAPDLERLETDLVAAVVRKYQVSRDVLAFDTSNFDSYTRSANPSRLLKRGHAKSKRTNLRVLGLGMLVTADDDGLPLLWFVYPGNHPDVRSFRSFLSRLKRRQRQLGVDTRSTVVCDGGNICKATVERIDADPNLHLVARLPTGHAPEADQLRTDELLPVAGCFGNAVRAKLLKTTVYGKVRTVVAVYSASMHASQVPGLKRDLRKATGDLQALVERLERQAAGKARGKPLTISGVRTRADKLLERQYMADLFHLDIGGTDARPTLGFRFDTDAWERLEAYRLGRTAVITDQDDWTVERIVSSLREQSHVEFVFRQLKDPQWASAVPLRHYTDSLLRVHAALSVLALLLAKLVVRRLKAAGIQTTVSQALHELSELRLAQLHYGPSAPPALKELARARRVPPKPNALQAKMIRALGIGEALQLGPTNKRRSGKKTAEIPATP
jgi:transposase